MHDAVLNKGKLREVFSDLITTAGTFVHVL